MSTENTPQADAADDTYYSLLSAAKDAARRALHLAETDLNVEAVAYAEASKALTAVASEFRRAVAGGAS